VSNAALEFMYRTLDNPEPVFAWVNFGAEHEPFYHDQADAGAFTGVGVPLTPSFNEEDVTDKPSNVRNLAPLSDDELAKMDQDYANALRSLLRVDRFIRDCSALLRSKGEMDNTYFVFYTDNGAHFGQHRFEHGKLQPYQEDTNFPLIVRGPGIEGGVKSGQLVGNHDIAPTLARMGARVSRTSWTVAASISWRKIPPPPGLAPPS
jgi:N-acetylglucosamine-6-sulfatase